MRGRPRVLLITNEARPGDSAGQVDGYRLLHRLGELGQVDVVSWREGFGDQPEGAAVRVASAIRLSKPDIAVVWSPKSFPASRSQFEMIRAALGRATILHWEGDAWHRGKPIPEPMTWWLSESHVLYSVGGPPQVTDLMAHGAREVRQMLHTYCHLQFRRAEETEPEPVWSKRVIMIGNNLMTIPGATGLPGSFKRWELGRRLSRFDGFQLRGSGWGRVGLRATQLPYRDQAKAIRASALSVNWDHFAYIADYASDRLPIGMIAGRAHVTVRHPGMLWAPTEDQGLFQKASPKEIVSVVEELMKDHDRLSDLGLQAHRWAKCRVSHREAARYIMASVVDSVAPPPADPWGSLPGPWTTRN